MKVLRRPLLWSLSRKLAPQTLDRYVLRRFAFIYASTFAVFITLFILIDAIEHLDDLARDAGSIWSLLRRLFLKYWSALPLVFCKILGPVIALTAALFTATVFQRANELVPVLASGRSYRRFFAPLLACGALLSGITFLIQELWVPRTVEVSREVAQQLQKRMLLSNPKYLDNENGILIALLTYSVPDRKGEGVTIYPVSRGRGRDDYIRARSMVWVKPEISDQGYWLLRDGVVQEYDREGRLVARERPDGEGGPALLYDFFVERPLETTLIPQEFEASKEVAYMSLEDLQHKVRDSGERRWILELHSRFADPTGSFILLLLGLPLIVHFGGRNLFFGALVSACVAAAYYVGASLCADLALRGLLSPTLGAWLAPIAFTALGTTWMRHLRS
jgi:lipopolysaccharide export LptBFGC system permease protein LptF